MAADGRAAGTARPFSVIDIGTVLEASASRTSQKISDALRVTEMIGGPSMPTPTEGSSPLASAAASGPCCFCCCVGMRRGTVTLKRNAANKANCSAGLRRRHVTTMSMLACSSGASDGSRTPSRSWAATSLGPIICAVLALAFVPPPPLGSLDCSSSLTRSSPPAKSSEGTLAPVRAAFNFSIFRVTIPIFSNFPFRCAILSFCCNASMRSSIDLVAVPRCPLSSTSKCASTRLTFR